MSNNSIVLPMCSFSYESNFAPIRKAEGIYVEDIDGKKYLDLISGLWNVPFGYSNEKIIEAICSQSKELSFCNLIEQPSDIAIHYASSLLEVLENKFKKLLYTCSGSESLELAIKICRKYQCIKGKF